jgi:hypothetical protein
MINSVLVAMDFDLVERSRYCVEHTNDVLVFANVYDHGNCTYVLMIARMNVPHGRLQESSCGSAVAPVTSLLAPS